MAVRIVKGVVELAIVCTCVWWGIPHAILAFLCIMFFNLSRLED